MRDLRGTRVAADIAIVWDWESWWALELDWRPSVDLLYRERMEAYYEQLWRDGITVDFVHPEGALEHYPLVMVPSLYMTTSAAAKNLDSYVENGGTLLVSYFSGIVDGNDTVHPGSYPGALRDLLGIIVEEFLPLRAGEQVRLDNGAVGDVWAEDIKLAGAEVVRRYADGPAAAGPAVTRHGRGAGAAWYVSTRLAGQPLRDLLTEVYADAGLHAYAKLPEGVELVRRPPFSVVINHLDHTVDVALPGRQVTVPAGEVRVVREDAGLD